MDNLSEIRDILKDHESRILKIESMIKNSSASPTGKTDQSIPIDLRRLIASNIDEIKSSSLIAIVLQFYGDLTKTKQIEILKKLGKKEADSLSGGNYNRDVVNHGLVHKVGTIGKDAVYTLTEKGRVEADKLIGQLKKQK